MVVAQNLGGEQKEREVHNCGWHGKILTFSGLDLRLKQSARGKLLGYSKTLLQAASAKEKKKKKKKVHLEREYLAY